MDMSAEGQPKVVKIVMLKGKVSDRDENLYSQSSHPCDLVIKNLVLIRIPINSVVRVKHITVVRMQYQPLEYGFTKFEITPGGGARPPIVVFVVE